MKDLPLRLAALLLALALPALGSQESPPLQQDLVDGAAALAKNDLPAAELAFREVRSQSEDVPQAWLGLSEVERRRANLAGALARLANKERYLAFEVPGRRYNIGVKYGLLNAQLALALSGVDRMEVLTQLVELLAPREITPNAD